MRLGILGRTERFEMGTELALGAVRLHSGDLDLDLWLLGSRRFRGGEDPAAELEFLLTCGDRFHGQAAYLFDLACFHCQVGDLIRTADCISRAVALYRSYQMRVLDHVDLEELRASCRAGE